MLFRSEPGASLLLGAGISFEGARIETAAFKCAGLTLGMVRMAMGPESRGSRPCCSFEAFDLKYALFDRPCVRLGSASLCSSAMLGSQNSTTLNAEAKMPVCTICIFELWPTCVSSPLRASSSSTFFNALANSRRIPVHSTALMLLCWNRSMSGDERRTDWYWRCSCDLRNSGGLYEGGWVEG